jgi:hypothetical protein
MCQRQIQHSTILGNGLSGIHECVEPFDSKEGGFGALPSRGEVGMMLVSLSQSSFLLFCVPRILS